MLVIRVEEMLRHNNLRDGILLEKKASAVIIDYIIKKYFKNSAGIVYDFGGIKHISAFVVDAFIIDKMNFFNGIIVQKLSESVRATINAALIYNLKSSNKPDIFLLHKSEYDSCEVLPHGEHNYYLGNKLFQALLFIMNKKSLTSVELAHGKKITVKNARIRLEKLFKYKLVYKEKFDGKENLYVSFY